MTEALELDAVSIGTLNDVTLTLAPGEIVCLSGPSGSGKTRLLRAIADLEPHGGTIRLGGTAQHEVPAHEWRRQVVLVAAESAWWADTVDAHFLHPARTDFSALGLSLDLVRQSVARLSSGEKQRLALLRAFDRAPRALLLDEPTAHLDPQTTRRVEEWLSAVARERASPVLWVAHDMAQIARVANRHVSIANGRVEAAWWS